MCGGKAMATCAKCGGELEPERTRAASISGSIMGDEYTDCFFLCPKCQAYTVVNFHDRFLGEETSSSRGPVSKAEGDAKVALIKQCSRPWDKKCRCAAHREYFGGWLD